MGKVFAISSLILGLLVFGVTSAGVSQAEECCPAPVDPNPTPPSQPKD